MTARAVPSLKLLHRAAAAVPLPPRLASALDGPLTHLLAERNKAELQLAQARLNVDFFLAACAVIRQEATGRPVNRQQLLSPVRDWIVKIQKRAAPAIPQRAD